MNLLWKGQSSNTNTRLFLACIPASILVWQKVQQQPGLSILLLGSSLFLCMDDNNEEVVMIDRDMIWSVVETEEMISSVAAQILKPKVASMQY